MQRSVRALMRLTGAVLLPWAVVGCLGWFAPPSSSAQPVNPCEVTTPADLEPALSLDRVADGLSDPVHPDYERNGRLFVDYTRRGDGATL